MVEPQGEAARSADLVFIPEGTELEVELLDAVSTRDSRAGQRVRARFVRGITVDNVRVPLKRWKLIGRVAVVMHPEGKDDRPGGLEIHFDTVRAAGGEERRFPATSGGVAEGTRKRNVGVVAGTAVLGAIIGENQGDTDEALVGAAAGAAAGAGIVRALPGRHLDLPEGAALVVTLVEDVQLPSR